MRVAALYDIHANLPALDAVLAEIDAAGVDLIVVGGDVIPGPMPRETMSRLLRLGIPAHFILGNGELAVLAQIQARDPAAVTYWGTTGGAELPERYREVVRWTARAVQPDYTAALASWPPTLSIDLPGLGIVLFCHGTPASETDAFTKLTPEEVLLPVFAGCGAGVVVCGHTHMPFDRMVGTTRVVNAGSVGAPFGRAGADWLLLDAESMAPRHTSYDLDAAAGLARATAYPAAEEFAAAILQPPAEVAILDVFTRISF